MDDMRYFRQKRKDNNMKRNLNRAFCLLMTVMIALTVCIPAFAVTTSDYNPEHVAKEPILRDLRPVLPLQRYMCRKTGLLSWISAEQGMLLSFTAIKTI